MAGHGTTARYNCGCRCDACKAAQSKRNRAYRQANAKAIAERERAYRQANRDAIRARGRKWYWENRAEESARRQNVTAERRDELNAASRKRRATAPNVEEWRRRSREYLRAHRAVAEARKRERNDISRRHAARNGCAWEAWEDHHLLNGQRTATELALMLGRTIGAVTRRRRLLRHKVVARVAA